ncbi:MAG: HAD family hydrolase [Planctomycetota bacterium]
MLSQAIIFDFDGVILESHTVKTNAFFELIRREFNEEHAWAMHDYHCNHLGISRFQKFEWFYRERLGKSITPGESRRLGKAFSDLVFEQVLAAPAVPGAVESLERLQSLGLKLFVASGTPQEELEQIVECRMLSSFFTEVWGTPSLKPDIIRDLMKRYEMEASQILFVGDGASDWKAARATHVPFLARTTEGTFDTWRARGVDQVPDLIGLADRMLATTESGVPTT